MEFKEKLKKYQNIVNNELEKYKIIDDKSLEKKLNNSIEYSMLSNGKRLRPILVLATYSLFSEDFEKVIAYAVAIEMVHNFSLIHDDLPGIDNDDFRHGKPTNHKMFGEATAILAGDSLLNKAYITISKNLLEEQNQKINNVDNVESIDLRKKIKVFNEFSIAVERMIAGEYVDTEVEEQKIGKNCLEYIHKNKTGALLKLSVRMGAILSTAKDEDVEKLSNYAEKIGLAFQIKDDILSEEGDEKVLGKPVGNDKEMQKCTYVSIYGLEKSKQILDEVINEAINELNIYGKKAEFLKSLAIYIKDRNK